MRNVHNAWLSETITLAGAAGNGHPESKGHVLCPMDMIEWGRLLTLILKVKYQSNDNRLGTDPSQRLIS